MSQRRSLSFFRRKKPEQKPKPCTLSSDLAMKILEKELDLEKSWDARIIHELMALYTQAVEYYEQHNNPKFYDFQDRMHKMLIKPQVIAVLQKINCPLQSNPESAMHSPATAASKYVNSLENPAETEKVYEKESMSTTHIKKEEGKTEVEVQKTKAVCKENGLEIRKEQAEMMRRKLSKELSKTLSRPKAHRNYNMIIDRHSSSSRETASRATADLKSQAQALERRLASRKKSLLTKSTSFSQSNKSDISCDLSDLYEESEISTKSSLFFADEKSGESCESFEKKLEKIMEHNFTERAGKIAEIKFRYESQINEIAGMGDIMDLLAKQMRANMQEEIDSVAKEYDMKRREEIKMLKEELCG